MSSNDQIDWTDSLDFESLADEQESRDAAAPDQAPGAAASAAAEPAPAAPAPRQAAGRRPSPRPSARPRVSGAGLGLLFAASSLVAAFGLAAALVMALGIDPVTLWQPQGLLQYREIIDFTAHPLNLVYLVTVATVLLALLGASAVARAVGVAGRSAARDAKLLDTLTALRIDDEKGWQDPLLRQHPAAAAFVNENVGAWRLNEARQRRAAGLEGEMQRLARAAGGNDRDGLADRFDNPNVGSLADELVRYFDERAAALQEVTAVRSKDREEAERLLNLIVEACAWTGGAAATVKGQAAALEPLVDALSRAGQDAEAGSDDGVAGAAVALRAARRDLAAMGAGNAGAADLEGLVDRINKLAFQIAMEVARLGQRGERLLPMTQALEELATEFRDAAGGGGVPAEALAAVDQALAQVQNSLDKAGADANRGGADAGALAPRAAAAAAKLAGLGSGFAGQSERLNQAGEACARMTGLNFDPQAVAPMDPVAAPEPDLGFTRFDPFAAPAAAPAATAPMAEPLSGAAEVDPFATELPAPALDLSFADPDPFLAGPQEEVYDLGGFGAVSLDEPVAPVPEAAQPAAFDTWDDGAASPVDDVLADAGDDVIDLASLGAVRLDHDEPAVAAPPAGLADEEIFDLAEFGAVPLD